MASAEGRATYAASSLGQDFRIPPNSSDHVSSVSEKLESSLAPNNSIDDHIHANSGSTPHDPNFARLSHMKWWQPHAKNNLGGKTNYACQHLNSWDPELSAVYAGYIGDNVKVGRDQTISEFDVLSYIGSDNTSVEQPWYAPPTCLKNNNNTRMPKTEASLNCDLHITTKKKDHEELCFSDAHLLDCDIASFSVSEERKMTSSDLESHLMGAEKTGPWWRNAGKDELASLVAQKSLENIENCDLPQPLTKKHIKPKPLYTKSVDHGKTPSSPLNQKAKIGSLIVDSCTSETPISGCSFQDSNTHFSSSQSKDSSSSNDDDRQINSGSGNMSELLEALCHSQTRAREAEKAAQEAYKEKEHVLSLFFRQASQLFAYKQWFHMLQLENLCLQLRNKNQPLLNLIPAAIPLQQLKRKKRKRKSSTNKKCGIGKCAVAFAIGLGLAGAGLILGWTMGWMFPSL